MKMQVRTERSRKKAKRTIYSTCIIFSLVLMVAFLAGTVVYLRRQLNDAEERYEQLKKTELVKVELPADTEAETVTEADSTEEPDKPVSSFHAVAVGKPEERTREEALDVLAALGKGHPEIEEICENSRDYPDKLLEALANNPEMADYAAGWTEDHIDGNVNLTEEEQKETYPLFLQWDARWGYHSYGTDSVIGLSGCGPACVAMMLYYLTGDEKFTPDYIGDYSMRQGHYVKGTGTSWALMTDAAKDFGVCASVLSLSESSMKEVLDAGGVIICAMRRGDFTAVGHFIVVYDYGSDGFYVNDPNCIARSRQSWSYDDLSGQIKNLWGYTK